MIVAWPGRRQGAVFQHRTSHYGVVPTLMQALFSCSNPSSDYSVGQNLFDVIEWDWEYNLSREPQFRGDVLEAVSEQNARYFRD